MTQPARLILASASPRRAELLREAGYSFDVHPANVNEDDLALFPIDMARHLAEEKAKAVAGQFENDLVLAADTVVAFGDQPLGKPKDADDARRMLALLSGTTHLVITGLCLMRLQPAVEQTRVVISAVRMKHLSHREIDAYVATNNWQGKAGGYGIQDQDPFVTKMSGSWTNIVGLPMEVTSDLLAEQGIFPR